MNAANSGGLATLIMREESEGGKVQKLFTKIRGVIQASALPCPERKGSVPHM